MSASVACLPGRRTGNSRPRSLVPMAFSERLAEALQAKVGRGEGWYARAGERLGVTRDAVYAWHAGRSYPSIGNLIAVRKLTGRSLDWLVEGRGS